MESVILFGVGSPLLVDVDESLHRAGCRIAAGVRNWPGPDHLPEGVPVVSPEDLAAEVLDLPFLVPLFRPEHRRRAAREAERLGFGRAFTLVDPSVVAPRRLEIGAGTYINVGVSLGGCSAFGPFVLINRGASIGHHARLGAFVSVGPGAVLAGNITMEAGSMVCAGATVLPNVTVGEGAVVGPGSVAARDVPGGCLVAGNPARIVRSGSTVDPN